MEEHHAAGRAVVIVSSSGDEVVGPVGEMLGADHVVATRMVVADGRETGEVAFYAFGRYKAKAMRELAAEHDWDLSECFAYSDSGTDVPMLEAVGNPFAVNPDKDLRKAAKERGWDILVFNKPVALRSRVLSPSTPTLAALAVGGAVAIAGGVIWAGTKRRRLGA